MRTANAPSQASAPAAPQLARRASDYADEWPEESTVRIPRESMQALVFGKGAS